MSVGAVVFVPCAPLLVPQVAGGSAELDDVMRTAALAAIGEGLAIAPDEVVVVAPVRSGGDWSAAASWDFSGFGVARTPAGPEERLPWPLGIGAWLLDHIGWQGPRRYLGIGSDPIGPAQAGSRTVVIAVGDGSACRTEKAPGYLDDRAAGFDAEVAAALARGDVAALGRLDADLAAELLCPSLSVWRWVAAAVNGADIADARVLVDVAPYGVGYFVARWLIAP